MCRDLVDDVVLVGEGEIAAGIRHAYWRERQIVEGAGAVGIAALLAGKVRRAGATVVLLSGRNIDMDLHHRHHRRRVRRPGGCRRHEPRSRS